MLRSKKKLSIFNLHLFTFIHFYLLLLTFILEMIKNILCYYFFVAHNYCWSYQTKYNTTKKLFYFLSLNLTIYLSFDLKIPLLYHSILLIDSFKLIFLYLEDELFFQELTKTFQKLKLIKNKWVFLCFIIYTHLTLF